MFIMKNKYKGVWFINVYYDKNKHKGIWFINVYYDKIW